MTPRIIHLEEKKLVGYSVQMSMVDNRTGEVWGRFAPSIKDIPNRLTDDKFSLQIYPESYFKQFNPNAEFEKWAAVEVEDFEHIPEGMHSFILEPGLYAVFDYKGSSTDKSIFQYIYSKWIPESEYELDERPHFEVLGSKYKNNDPESEEEIWIPIRKTDQ